MRCVSAKTLGSACAIGALAFISMPALAQGVHNNHLLRYTQAHGMTFSEIGDPGNPDSAVQIPGFGIDHIQGVDYRYRISTTEVTIGQYAEFVEAVAPHIKALGGNAVVLAGHGTLVWLGSSGGVPRYLLEPGTENRPAKNELGYFALMANWLHNGAPSVKEANIVDFQSGAYTDWRNPTRSEGAEYWVPSRDEWVKAAHWDPNKNGPGEGGYWMYPDGGDEPLIPGDPALGGETSAGNGFEWPEGHFKPFDVGSYPDTQSPWGLLDASGSEREWTDTRRGSGSSFYGESSSRGTTSEDGMVIFSPGDALANDAMHTPRLYNSGSPPITVRFAAAIPSPGVPALLGIAAFFTVRRRSRHAHETGGDGNRSHARHLGSGDCGNPR